MNTVEFSGKWGYTINKEVSILSFVSVACGLVNLILSCELLMHIPTSYRDRNFDGVVDVNLTQHIYNSRIRL